MGEDMLLGEMPIGIDFEGEEPGEYSKCMVVMVVVAEGMLGV